jgi:hypothetical protein
VEADEAARLVAEGTPAVLVGQDGQVLGEVVAAAQDQEERLLGVMVGDPAQPGVLAAAAEMAGELWPWAGARSRQAGTSSGEAGTSSGEARTRSAEGNTRPVEGCSGEAGSGEAWSD